MFPSHDRWGWSVNENRDSFIGLPLIFYAIKQTSATSISFGSDSGTKIQLTSYIIPSNSLSLNPSTSKVNIHFQVETNEYQTIVYLQILCLMIIMLII